MICGSGGHSFAGASVLITGARGFIASSLAAKLSRAGAKINGASRTLPDRRLPGVDAYHAIDLADGHHCRSFIEALKPEIVFHMASHVSGRQDIETLERTLSGNLVATVNLLSSLHETKSARSIVIAGSCEEPRIFRNDDLATAPSSPYAAAKLSASAYAAFFRHTLGLPVCHGRIFMGYGPGQMDLLKLVPYVTVKLLKGGVPRLSSGGRVADFVFVDDIVDGLLHLAANPSITTLDIGTGKLTSVADVARGLRDIINPSGKLGFGSLPDRINETDRVADVKRTAALTGWRPRYELAEGLHRTVDWYREHLPALGWME